MPGSAEFATGQASTSDTTMQPYKLPEGIRAILFDVDGTLVHTENRWAFRLASRLARLQRIWPDFDVEALARRMVLAIEMPANYAVLATERLGLQRALRRLADRARRSKGLASRDASVLIEGTEGLLRNLAGRYLLGVVTTRARPEALALLGMSGVGKLFGVVITRHDVWFMKPHPQPIRRAAARLGVRPEECVMVGDTIMDIRAARSAGAHAVGVLTGTGTREELERAGAHLILARVAELGDCL